MLNYKNNHSQNGFINFSLIFRIFILLFIFVSSFASGIYFLNKNRNYDSAVSPEQYVIQPIDPFNELMNQFQIPDTPGEKILKICNEPVNPNTESKFPCKIFHRNGKIQIHNDFVLEYDNSNLNEEELNNNAKKLENIFEELISQKFRNHLKADLNYVTHLNEKTIIVYSKRLADVNNPSREFLQIKYTLTDDKSDESKRLEEIYNHLDSFPVTNKIIKETDN
jgi:hypothetical protein